MTDDIRQLNGPIAVFGGGGFVGANLVRRILEERNDCYAVTHQDYIPWRLLGLPTDRILRCDIRNATEVKELFQRIPIKTVFCFAAYGAYSRQREALTIYQTNVLGLLNILQAAESSGVQSLVHAGSSSEYGSNCSAPKEDSVLLPNSHYSVSKVSASYLLKYFSDSTGLPTINLRFYSVYGPYEEFDRFIPQLVEHGLNKTLPPLVNPNISRDFIYISDAVDASLRAAVRGVNIAKGSSLNIGTGKKTTIGEVVEISRELFSIDEKPQWGSMPNRQWDLADWYSDPSYAEKVLQWKATTQLSEGLKRMANWVKVEGLSVKNATMTVLQKSPRLSAVIACYRDAQAIPVMHERLTKVFRKIGVDYEIIFVNDASPDETDDVLREICEADPHVISLEHSRNFGSQNAFLDGMYVSRGDAVILLDGDLQDPPEIIEQFYQQWKEGYEVVYGRRVRREATLFLQLAYKSFYRLLRKMAYIPIPVDAGDFSLMDRKVVQQLISLPETDQFLRGLRAWVGFRQIGVDYIRPERPFGTSTNNYFKNFWWARKAIFNFSFAPVEFLLYGGIGLTGLSFMGLVGQVIARLLDPSIPHGISTVIILILFFGGLNMLGLSILGEYIGKVFEETKRRPKYIRRAIRYGNEHLTSAEAIEGFFASRSATSGQA